MFKIFFYKNVCTSAIVLASLLTPIFASADGGHDRVSIELQSPSVAPAGITEIQFTLKDFQNNASLTPDDLNVTHEKKLHLIAYDPGLKEFHHLHPEFDGQVWTATTELPVNGEYYLWAQGEIGADSEEFNAQTRLAVEDGLQAWPTPQLTDVRVGEDSGSFAILSKSNLKAGKMAMLTLTFTKADGSPSNATPYLGAFAHVIATPQDGSSLIHVHPMDGKV